MKTWVRRSLNVGVLGAGFLLVSGTAAQADMVSGPNAGIASGNQLSSVLQVPVDISGNAVSVLGFADAASGGGAAAVNTESATTESAAANTEAGMVTGMNGGGFANASCVGGAGAVNGGGGWDNDGNGSGSGSGSGYGGHGAGSGYGGHGAGSGYGGGAAGDNYGGGSARNHDYDGGARGDYDMERRKHHGGGQGSGSGMGGGSGALSNGGADMVTGYNAGILTGNQVSSVIQAPIDVSGNAVSVLGFANARSGGGAAALNESATTESATTEGMVSGFNAGILSGNQISNVVQVPISVCGNSIAVLGFANASCVGGAAAVNGGGGGGFDRDRDRDWNNDDEDPVAAPSGVYPAYADPAGQGARPTAHSNAAHKATKKAAKKAKKNEHSRFGARGNNRHHDWDGNGRGNSNNGGGYGNGGAAGADDDNNGGSWGGNGGGSCGSDMVTGYNAGLLSGNQLSSVVQVPIDFSGNAISILGFANAQSVGGAAAVNC
jgi:hypothetical protein